MLRQYLITMDETQVREDFGDGLNSQSCLGVFEL